MSTRVPLRLLRPGWLLLHVLVVAAAVVMYRLGTWQWGRGSDSGSIRNYSYGLEWWAFALLTAVGYVKHCHDEVAQAAPTLSPEAEPEVPVAQPQWRSAPSSVVVTDDETDPEVAAWNARFRELAARDDR